MAITGPQALQFIAEDEKYLLELLFQIDNQKIVHREGIEEVLERWLVSQLTDDEGYLKPGALTPEQIDEFQAQLTGAYAPGVLDAAFSEVVDLVDDRLLTIDNLMRTLELEDGILGNAVFEMETVQNEISSIAEGFVRGPTEVMILPGPLNGLKTQ